MIDFRGIVMPTETRSTSLKQESVTPGAASRLESSLSRVSVSGWLGLAVILFFLQTLPCLSNRWFTDDSWYSAPVYSVAQGNGFLDPAIGPNDIENQIDTRPRERLWLLLVPSGSSDRIS